jgi:hypothetical protein
MARQHRLQTHIHLPDVTYSAQRSYLLGQPRLHVLGYVVEKEDQLWKTRTLALLPLVDFFNLLLGWFVCCRLLRNTFGDICPAYRTLACRPLLGRRPDAGFDALLDHLAFCWWRLAVCLLSLGTGMRSFLLCGSQGSKGSRCPA